MAPELRLAGFKVRANTWHKPCQDTILVVNLQKSQWGKSHDINLAIWVKQLGEAQAPKEYECHIRERATSLPSEKTKALERALDLADTSLDPEQRRTLIAGFMREEALPFLDSLATLEGIRSALDTQRLKGSFVSKKLRKLLAATG